MKRFNLFTFWRRTRKITAYILLTLITLGVLTSGTGIVYNLLAIRHYRNVAGMPGKLYDVGGYRMHLYYTGEGSPTLILDGGLGEDWLDWRRIQPALSKVTCVCSYDRAGFGWSDARPGVRDANTISDELHSLLLKADLTEPVILMGHSIAGLYMRAYTARYPKDVVGLVFVDASTPLQFRRSPHVDSMERTNQEKKDLLWELLTRTLGIDRLHGDCTIIPDGAEDYAAWIKADECNPVGFVTVEREWEAKPISGSETVTTGPFGDLPILVLSEDPYSYNFDSEGSLIWNDMQEDLKKLSTSGYRVIAKGSGHEMQVEASNLLNRKVTNFIGQVRNHTPPPEGYGTTTAESIYVVR